MGLWTGSPTRLIFSRYVGFNGTKSKHLQHNVLAVASVDLTRGVGEDLVTRMINLRTVRYLSMVNVRLTRYLQCVFYSCLACIREKEK